MNAIWCEHLLCKYCTKSGRLTQEISPRNKGLMIRRIARNFVVGVVLVGVVLECDTGGYVRGGVPPWRKIVL